MDRDLEFENEFISDEEAEAVLDGLVEMIKDEYAEESVSVINPKRVRELLNVYRILKYATKKSKVKMSYEVNEPCVGMGSVSIVGSDITFTDTKYFRAAAMLASNFNVYPKTNGDVCIDFTFHGITTDIEEE